MPVKTLRTYVFSTHRTLNVGNPISWHEKGHFNAEGPQTLDTVFITVLFANYRTGVTFRCHRPWK